MGEPPARPYNFRFCVGIIERKSMWTRGGKLARKTTVAAMSSDWIIFALASG